MANVVQIVISAANKTDAAFHAPIRSLQDLEKAAKNLQPAMIGLSLAAAGLAAGMVKGFIESATEARELSRVLGGTIEQASLLNSAASRSGVSFETLTKGIKHLSTELASAFGGDNASIRYFDQLGVSIKNTNGQLRPTEQVLLQLADKFASTADGAGKTAVALKLFGRSGDEMIGFLDKGSAGILELEHKAKSFGLEVSGATAIAIKGFKEKLADLQDEMRGAAGVFLSSVIPAWTRFKEAIGITSDESVFFITVANTVSDVLKGLMTVVVAVWTGLKTFFGILGTGGRIIVEVFGGAIKTGIELVQTWYDAMKALGSAMLSAFIPAVQVTAAAMTRLIARDLVGAVQVAQRGVEVFGEKFTSLGAPISTAVTKSGSLIKQGFGSAWSNVEAITKQSADDIAAEATRAAEAILAIFSAGPAAPERPKGNKTDLTPPSDSGAENLALMRKNADEITQISNAMFLSMLQGSTELEAAETLRYEKRKEQILDLARTEEELIALELEAEGEHQANLGKIREKGAESEKQIQQRRLDGLKSMFGNMASASKAFGREGFEASKAFASAQALIATYEGAPKAYSALADIPYVGPALGAAAAAACIAAGLANVAQIESASYSVGTSFVPVTQVATVHAGERIVPGKMNEDLAEYLEKQGQADRFGEGGKERAHHYHLHFDGHEICSFLMRAARDGRLQLV